MRRWRGSDGPARTVDFAGRTCGSLPMRLKPNNLETLVIVTRQLVNEVDLPGKMSSHSAFSVAAALYVLTTD